MVALHLSFPTTFNHQAKLPFQGLASSRQKHVSKLHSSISPGCLFICNSEQLQHPTNPISLFPPVDQVSLLISLHINFLMFHEYLHNVKLMFETSCQSVAAIVFGDGSESRLYPLTKRRSEGAIPLAANYRLIDAVVSNCINSNINKIYALTQFNSTSLNCHLSRAYSGVLRGKDGFVEVIAAYQSPQDQGWFQVSQQSFNY